MTDVIFVHGWATDSFVWNDAAEAVKKDGLSARNIDLPGHGGPGRWTIPTLEPAANAVLRSASEFTESSVVGIGWSIGAEALLLSAAIDPARFKGLVLTGATPCFVEKNGFPYGQSRAMVKRMILDMKKDPKGTLERFYPVNFTEDEMKGGKADAFMERYRYPGPVKCDGATPACEPSLRHRELTFALEALYNADLRSVLGAIDVPVLVIHGGQDPVCPASAGMFLAGAIRGAELAVFDNAGHAPFITEPERFLKAVREFLKRI